MTAYKTNEGQDQDESSIGFTRNHNGYRNTKLKT
jgi:hypothetical protein